MSVRSHDPSRFLNTAPATAGVPEHRGPRVDGPRLQLLHLLQQRLPHRATGAGSRGEQKGAGQALVAESLSVSPRGHVQLVTRSAVSVDTDSVRVV